MSSFLSKNQKSLEIQRDAKDPQLMANLSRMEPVRVYHHMLPTGTVSLVRLALPLFN